MSIFKDLINFTAGLMGLLFDKYETSIVVSSDGDSWDDLTRIEGIGPTYARRLSEAGIHSFRQLASLSTDEVREITGAGGPSDPGGWIAQARSMS